MTGQLEHPNIVPVHEIGMTADGGAYFTMKRVRGKDLEAVRRSEEIPASPGSWRFSSRYATPLRSPIRGA